MSTREDIKAAALKRRKTKDIPLGDGVTVSVHEMTPAENRSLFDRMWEKGPDGNYLVVDKDGKPSTNGDGYYMTKPGINVKREWLLATMTPADAVDDILTDDVPDSLKEELFNEARAINGIEPADVTAKNS